MTAPEPVLCAVDQGIAMLTLNRPEKRNALARPVLEALKAHLEAIARDPQARAVILRAAGPVFSSGHDLAELAQLDEPDCRSLFALCTEVMEGIRKLPSPVIAQVQGLATAAGCQLAASCDLVVAAETAAFATPGVKIGLFCTTPGVALSRAVGAKKAMEMLLTGRPISAREAEQAGLVNRVVSGDQLEAETLALARQIIAASPRVLAAGKQAFYAQLPLDRPAAYALAEEVMVESCLKPDAKEGIAAFLGKRPPQWPR
jgi:enoyl-CoA hydratase/carnithine racemase